MIKKCTTKPVELEYTVWTGLNRSEIEQLLGYENAKFTLDLVDGCMGMQLIINDYVVKRGSYIVKCLSTVRILSEEEFLNDYNLVY